ncbi:ClpX C4-type zinc finger protein [Hyalangium gracile]|uniref:ClpX C4-type zinc finger protein n=1 Tax=Hyalangium gracile TaxID=394092 RepID=UPI001CCB0121|nr:ClpX C4-type zinc finger protein [Hyalangium gracile]
MANPRDHIRAAQAAELRGDKAGAISELRKAAELLRRSGNMPRALHLLRHARKLDPSRSDVAEELGRLEQLSDSPIAGALQTEGDGSEAGVRQLRSAPEELAERQRLIEEALRNAGASEVEAEVQDEVRRWNVEEPRAGAAKAPELQDASRRALEWARQHAQEDDMAPRKWSVDESDARDELELRPVEESERPEEEEAVGLPRGHATDVTLQVRPLVVGDVRALVADVEIDAYEPASEPREAPAAEEYQEDAPAEESRAEEPGLIDRGPTRADPAIDAWCSFCCRPSAEVGELVAGPTGSFICAACVTESRGLLSLEDTAVARPRAARRKSASSEAMPLIGQQEARELLERAVQAGARRLLVIGPEGTGKTVWFRELEREDRGTIVTLDTLEQGGGSEVVLLEDVDRYMSDDWTRLSSLIARYPERTVLMSARGSLEAPSLVLRGATGSLPVFTTSVLSAAVLDSVPLELLELVQVAIPLQVPTEAEFLEIARRRLALRGAELSLSDGVLSAFATEAARSARAGHELNALLARVLAGSWSLEGEQKQASGKKAESRGAVGKGTAKKPSRRGRRKGTV